MKKKFRIALLMAACFIAGAAFMYWAIWGWVFTEIIEAIERITV